MSILTFKTPRQEFEFKTRIHPDIRLLLVEMGQWSKDNGLPAPCITQLYRSRGEQVALYVEYWQRLQRNFATYEQLPEQRRATAVGGHNDALFPSHNVLEQARVYSKMNLLELTKLATERPTLHEWDAACDLRTKHYATIDQLAAVKRWVAAKCNARDEKTGKPLWGIETNLHGSGPHIHLGRNDHAWIEKAKIRARQPLTS